MTFLAILELQISDGALPLAKEILEQILEQTRSFPGCLGIDVFEVHDDEHNLVLIEKWDSEESDTAYRRWRSTEEGATRLPSVLASAPRLTKVRPV